MAMVPSVAFVMVSSFSKVIPLAPVIVKPPLKVVVGDVIKSVPSVALDIISPFPNSISSPVTVKSPLTVVVAAVMAIVPSVAFVMVSSFSKVISLTLKLVPVIVVNVPAAGVVPPITLLFTVPPETVRSSATYVSVTAVPCHIPEETVPTASMASSFAVVITVPVTSGRVIVRSAVGSSSDSVVS